MKKISIVFSIFFFIATLSFAQEGKMDNEAAKLYNAGNKQKKSGDYAGAISTYGDALKISKDYRIYYQMSSAYKKQRKFQEAEQALNACVELNPKFTTAYNALGTTYYSWGKYQQAVDSFKKFEESTEKKKAKKKAQKYIGLSYTKLGSQALKDKSYGKATEYLMSAVSNYNYDAAYLKLADIYIETGKYSEALQAADNAINYRSKKSKLPKGAPYFYKGLAFKGLKQYDKAKENFSVAKKDKQYRDRSKHEMKYMN
ncbi:MAG: tetratricopeptide repeat protein [Melioribacteraceae bacterium]